MIYLFIAFYARRIVQPIFPYNRFGPANGVFPKGYVKAYRNAVMGLDASPPQFTTLDHRFHFFMQRPIWLLILVLQAYTVYILAYHPDSFDIYALLALPVVTTKPISISSESLNKLHPYWVTGFIDAEGCFQIIIFSLGGGKIRENLGEYLNFCLPFSHMMNDMGDRMFSPPRHPGVGGERRRCLHKKDRSLLEGIRALLGGIGSITNLGKDSVQYRVSSVKDL